MNFKRIKKWPVLITLIIAGAGIAMVSFNDADDFKIVKNLDIFYTLFREVNLYYVDEVDPEKLVDESIDGMLESLDPYTKFISAEEMKDFEFQTTGEYGGIGALIRKKEGKVIISEPYRGFPADKAGLKAGDVILEIEGKKITDENLREVSDLLKGVPNTDFIITIKRPGIDKPMDKTITREKITISNVPHHEMLEDGIGYIRLSGFTQDAGKEAEKALKSLKKEHDLTSLILDLRDNPGGLLMEAVNVSNLFVPKNQEIVSTKGKVKRWNNAYSTENNPVDTTLPLVVLVNSSSASASEIVSGSLQDLDRAVVLGERTFGKGLVQTTRPLSYNSKLKVTTAKYYIPSGRSIQAMDYSKRNEDGSVGQIPDSLKKEFTTRKGRKVYGGGGIEPDIEVKPEQASKIAISLYTKNFIFDFATRFAISHDTIPQPDEFEINDNTYGEFKTFISGKDFDYETRSENQLKELMEIAKKEKYYQKAPEEFEALRKKLAHDKEKDLEIFQDDIRELMEQEIAGRYYYQAGKIQVGLETDKQVDKAIQILKDQNQYDSILAGNTKEKQKLSAASN